MGLAERIADDLKQAMLAGDKTATSTLRMLKSELKNAEIAAGQPLDDAAVLQVVRREAKKRAEASELFRSSGNDEMATQEEAEAGLLRAYLPAQIDPAQVEEYVLQYLKENPLKQKGEAIRATLAHFNGQTDGKTVSEIVGRLLS